MHRISLSLMALASALSPAALAENQIWTAAGAGAKPFQNKAISLDFDADLRYQPDGDLDTIELRPGIGYRLNDRFKISGGYLWASARRDRPDRIEHRLWQQVSYDFGAAYGLEFDGRSRFEERRREGWNDTGVRLRQEFGVKRPLEGTPFVLSLSTDLYFELNKTDWGQAGGFTEARTEAKIEWDASETVSWEFGYLNQFEYDRSGPDQTNHHIVVGVSKDF
ncbi:MAG: DUF2490 domain-containing protein [Hyphomonas sp.]